MVKTASEYRSMLLRLLPRGILWRRAGEGRIGALLAGYADELARLEGDADRVLVELTPATSTEALDDWEEELGLPDECAPAAQNIDERRAAVIRKLQRGQGMSKAYYLALLKEFGFEDVYINEISIARVDHTRVDDLLFSEDAAHTFIVTLNSMVTLRRFRTGASSTPDLLLDWQETGVECVIRREKPAHTSVIFNILDTEEA